MCFDGIIIFSFGDHSLENKDNFIISIFLHFFYTDDLLTYLFKLRKLFLFLIAYFISLLFLCIKYSLLCWCYQEEKNSRRAILCEFVLRANCNININV